MPMQRYVNKVDDILRKKEDADILRILKELLHPLGYRDVTFEKRWSPIDFGMRIGLSMTWPGFTTSETLFLTMQLSDFEEWLYSRCLNMPRIIGWHCSSENPSCSIGRVLKSNGTHYLVDGAVKNYSDHGPSSKTISDSTITPNLRKMDID